MDICPRCGTKSKGGHLCSACASEIHPRHAARAAKLDACSSCRRIRMRGSWKSMPFDDALCDAVHRAWKGRRIRSISLSGDDVAWGPGQVHEITSLARMANDETAEIHIKLSITTCPACSRRGGQYFEGVLQLRNPSRQAINRLYAHVGALADRGVFINKEVKEKNGIDFYLTSQKHLQTVAKKLQREFGGILRSAPQLFTKDKQTSKDIFRVNVVLTFPPFVNGDVVFAGDRLIRITRIGKSASGIDVQSAKRVALDARQVRDARVLPKRRAKVLTVYPNPTILHPDTFEHIALIAHEPLRKDQNVKIVIWKEKAYLL